MKILDYILDRLDESSTWRGIIMLATAIGVKLDGEQTNTIIAAGLSLVALINIFRKQK